jgi:8-oxo-dGTP pyrophosphatase MutT (NUDIX family)
MTQRNACTVNQGRRSFAGMNAKALPSNVQDMPVEIRAMVSVLSSELPGWAAQQWACPPGRPKDVDARIRRARRAGVMAILCPNDEGAWSVLLMQRTEDGSPHSGQISLPGGSEEAGDCGDLKRTAMRECAEEVGVELHENQMIGSLSPLYIPPSDFWVSPFVAWCSSRPRIRRQHEEVARVMFLPLASLPNPGLPWGNLPVKMGRGSMQVPGMRWENQVLWGATAMMLSELNHAWHLAWDSLKG